MGVCRSFDDCVGEVSREKPREREKDNHNSQAAYSGKCAGINECMKIIVDKD